jgi:hypothetical protein
MKAVYPADEYVYTAKSSVWIRNFIQSTSLQATAVGDSCLRGSWLI